jgi:hypothetical protein
MTVIIMLISSPRLRAAEGPEAVARALQLKESGDALEATLALRRLAEEGTPTAQDLARFHLGLLAAERDDWEGAAQWLERVGATLQDGRMQLERAARLSECYARTGRGERVVPLLKALREGPLGGALGAALDLRVLEVALGTGRPEWVAAVLGKPTGAALDAVLAAGRAEDLARLAALKGWSAEEAVRLNAALGSASGPGLLEAAVRAGSAWGGGKALLERFPSLAAPGDGVVLVPVPLTGPNALFGAALTKVLSYLDSQRSRVSPWRLLDTEAEGWLEAFELALGTGQVVAVLGPLGAKTRAALEPLLARHPLPWLPLFPPLARALVPLPELAVMFAEDEVLAALLDDPQVALAGRRVLVLASPQVEARGLPERARARLEAAGSAVVAAWVLPPEAKKHTEFLLGKLAGLGWKADAPGVPPVDTVLLATSDVDGLRALNVLLYAGLPLAPRVACTADKPCLKLLALRPALGPGLLDSVSHLSDSALVADPCPADPAALEGLRNALGRAPFAVEVHYLQVAQVLAQALDLAAEGTALDLLRSFIEERRWNGVCGTLTVKQGRGQWPIRVGPLVPPTPTPEPQPKP